jgi:hypothetical protein
MSKFKEYMEIAQNLYSEGLIPVEKYAKKNGSKAEQDGSKELNDIFSYFQQRLNRTYIEFSMTKEKELAATKDEEKQKNMKNVISVINKMGAMGLKAGSASTAKEINDIANKKNLDKLPIDETANVKSFQDFKTKIEQLETSRNYELLKSKNESLKKIDEEGKKYKTPEEDVNEFKKNLERVYNGLAIKRFSK